MKISVSALLVEEQSLSFPGRVLGSSADFLLTNSRALLAASAARMAAWAFATTLAITSGARSIQSPRASHTAASTTRRTSGFPSLVLVWPSNSGLRSLTATTQLSPSLTCAPVKLGSLSLDRLCLRARALMVRVTAVLVPSRCMPPSTVRILLAYPRMVSENESRHHCMATSTSIPSTSFLRQMASECSTSLPRFSQCTYSSSPPAKWYSSGGVWVLAVGGVGIWRWILSLELRKASSRSRAQITVMSISVLVKIWVSGRNLMRVPLLPLALEGF
mmetsp:Transcript_17094/g.23587  ORF Transcript_17094/g.23587 Transcript_17094/m.23587 type:complete len:275 (-) Transcript_17094:256-1080(-)